MLKCNIKTNGMVWVKTGGTAQALMREVAMLIQQIYQHINKQNPEAAKGFKNNLLGLLLDPDSPVWKQE